MTNATHNTTNLTVHEAAARAELLQVDGYQVTLNLTGSASTFQSATTVTFSCARPGSDTFIDLIAPRVTLVELNGKALAATEVYDGSARIRLTGLAEHNTLRVEAECAYMTTGEGMHRFLDPVDDQTYLYTQFEVADARRVFACFDQPDLKSRFTFTVTAPSHWQVVSNAPASAHDLAGNSDGDGGRADAPPAATWRFEPTAVLPTYVTAIVAGPYHQVRDTYTSTDGHSVPLALMCRASLAEHLDAEELFDITRSGFSHFESLFGRAYPFSDYCQIFVPEFNAGAMENAGAVTFAEAYVFRSQVPDAVYERRATTVLHEMAHMWFGDLVTMRWWNDLWLNESFAEYASTVAVTQSTRWTGAWATFATAHKAWAYRQDQLPSTHPVVAPIWDLDDVQVNFDGITYAKGAAVLKQLVAWVGRAKFEEGVRRYFATHAWGNTTLADLLSELERTSGRDLRDWSRLWLQTAGVNTLRPLVGVQDGEISELVIEQTAPGSHPQLRPHRLAVGGYHLQGEDLVRSWRVELDVDGARTAVPEAAGRAMPDLLLLNDDDLTYAKIRLDEDSLATAIKHLGRFADSLPRALVWAAAWDMTRDAELSTDQFLDLVLRNVAAEKDSSVLQNALRQAAAALRSYVPVADRAASMSRVGDQLLQLAQQAPEGSGHQLQLLKAAAAHAVSPATANWLRRLLDGDPALPSWSVDTELRWDLVIGLAAAGVLDEERIAAELANDPTASGQLRARTARAAVPTAAAKEAAWESILSASLPNAAQEAAIAGFTTVHDPTPLTEYVEPYFESLEPVWQERTHEMAQQFVLGMYPHQLASPELLARADAWLDDHRDASAALRRLVSENRDGTRRALATQASWRD